jgi:hypothetical protein
MIKTSSAAALDWVGDVQAIPSESSNSNRPARKGKQVQRNITVHMERTEHVRTVTGQLGRVISRFRETSRFTWKEPSTYERACLRLLQYLASLSEDEGQNLRTRPRNRMKLTRSLIISSGLIIQYSRACRFP